MYEYEIFEKVAAALVPKIIDTLSPHIKSRADEILSKIPKSKESIGVGCQ